MKDRRWLKYRAAFQDFRQRRVSVASSFFPSFLLSPGNSRKVEEWYQGVKTEMLGRPRLAGLGLDRLYGFFLFLYRRLIFPLRRFLRPGSPATAMASRTFIPLKGPFWRRGKREGVREGGSARGTEHSSRACKFWRCFGRSADTKFTTPPQVSLCSSLSRNLKMVRSFSLNWPGRGLACTQAW